MILVTGGTGLVGSHLLLQLMQEGNAVRAIYRSPEKVEKTKQLFALYGAKNATLFDKIAWVKADILDIPALEEAFIGITKVYHCAALISFNPRDFKKLMKINAQGTANVVNLCLAHSIKKCCYVSTIGTIGHSITKAVATEETEWNDAHANVYALSKYEAEMEMWRGSQEGLNVVMVNPGVIIGPTDWNRGSGKLFTTANSTRNYYPPGGSGFIGVTDVARMMVELMESAITNQRFIAVSDNLSYGEVLPTISAAIGKKAPQKELKMWQLKVLYCADSVRCFITRKAPKITKQNLWSLQNRQHFSSDKIKEQLNFKFSPLQESIAFTAKCFKENLF